VAPRTKRISDDRVGCIQREYFEKLTEYAVQADKKAFYSGLVAGMSAGICTVFKAGEEVFITDTAIFSG
jgi:hypothetical protein